MVSPEKTKAGALGGDHPMQVSHVNVPNENAVTINMVQDWHALTVEEVARFFHTDIQKGLLDSEAANRLKEHGPNELSGSSGPSVLQVLMANLFNAMNGVLAAALILGVVVQDWPKTVILALVIATNTLVGFYQEYRSEKTMDALRKMASPTARAIRNREIKIVQSREVVPGDLIALEEGDIVPADLRLIEAVNLETDEALLTGESIPVAKVTGPILSNPESTPLPASDQSQPTNSRTAASLIPLGDRKNLVYSSTLVSKGRGIGICVATGLKTEVGKIASAVSDTTLGSKTPAQRFRELARRQKQVGKRFMARLLRRQKRHAANNNAGADDSVRKSSDDGDRQLVDATTSSVDSGSNSKTPLQRTLSRVMFLCVAVALVLAVIVFGANEWSVSQEVLLYAISVAVAILPEGMPAVITVTLAIAVKRIAKQKAIVRKLAALESLGQVTNVCSDKTGTLTEGKMVVKNAWFGFKNLTVTGKGIEPIGDVVHEVSTNPNAALKVDPLKVTEDPVLHRAFLVCSLCLTSTLFFDEEEKRWKATGDPTEIALQVLGAKMGMRKESLLESDHAFAHEYPFDSFLKRMSVVYKNRNLSNNNVEVLEVFAKGALERVLECCDSYYDEEGQIVPLTKDFEDQAQAKMLELAGKGMRVLALAYRRMERDHPSRTTVASTDAVNPSMTRLEAEQSLIFLGLVAMYDPPRVESAPSVAMCRKAGIVVHMATGDHPKTAEAIAQECGILSSTDANRQSGLIMTAAEFDSMTDAEIDRLPELPRVLARCAPETKVRLVRALHRRNKAVAMSGDGVNDAPAIKSADVGVSMGLGGSDVTKQASSITLTDDNFHTIVVAIREGRRIFANSTLIISHLLSCNVAEVVALIIGLAVRDVNNDAVFPMSAIQILWVNMLTSSPVALALGMEFASPDIMDVPPRAKGASVWTPELVLDIFVYGFVMGLLSLGSFLVTIAVEPSVAGLKNIPRSCNNRDLANNPGCQPIFAGRAVAFYSLSLLLLVHGFNCRHLRFSAFLRQAQNKYLWLSAVLGVVLVIPTAYLGNVSAIVFSHTTFDWQWGIIAIDIVFFIIFSEAYKATKRRWYRRKDQKRMGDDNGNEIQGNAPLSMVVTSSS
ncbi:hypothetical protein HK102_008419 [Quaeritorhiza haematococci]|nr:hypothetical protein HK102_008419 [Quaeritorhiza haematococci]